MNLTFHKKARLSLGTSALLSALALAACGDINSSWEVKGGGYLKYSINDDGPYPIVLSKNDARPTTELRHYFYALTQSDESERGDQISLMVNNPRTGTNLTPEGKASLNGRYEYVTWLRTQFTAQAPIVTDSSSIKFDEISDSLWSANLDLYFMDCRSGKCIDTLPPLHLTGRLRYWVPADER